LPIGSIKRKFYQIVSTGLKAKKRQTTREKKQGNSSAAKIQYVPHCLGFRYQMLTPVKNHHFPLHRLSSKRRTERVAESWPSFLWE